MKMRDRIAVYLVVQFVGVQVGAQNRRNAVNSIPEGTTLRVWQLKRLTHVLGRNEAYVAGQRGHWRDRDPDARQFRRYVVGATTNTDDALDTCHRPRIGPHSSSSLGSCDTYPCCDPGSARRQRRDSLTVGDRGGHWSVWRGRNEISPQRRAYRPPTGVSGTITRGTAFEGFDLAGLPFTTRVRDNGSSATQPPDEISNSHVGDETSCFERADFILRPTPQGQVIVH